VAAAGDLNEGISLILGTKISSQISAKLLSLPSQSETGWNSGLLGASTRTSGQSKVRGRAFIRLAAMLDALIASRVRKCTSIRYCKKSQLEYVFYGGYITSAAGTMHSLLLKFTAMNRITAAAAAAPPPWQVYARCRGN